jgi:endonuclease YncB( thermonuclease family)
MLVARYVRRGLLILSVYTLGFFMSSFSTVPALDFTAPVVSVLDGDTIEVLHNQHPERIRLSGIDCPGKGQSYGTRGKQAASLAVISECAPEGSESRTARPRPNRAVFTKVIRRAFSSNSLLNATASFFAPFARSHGRSWRLGLVQADLISACIHYLSKDR